MKTIYQCELCGYRNEDARQVAACESRGLLDGRRRHLTTPEFNVGDFVVTDAADYGRFGWFDGDENWVIKKPWGLHSGPHESGWPKRNQRAFCVPAFTLIYVVVGICSRGLVAGVGDGHDVCYMVETKGMLKGYRRGWTVQWSHYQLHPANDIAMERGLDAAELLSQRADFRQWGLLG